MKLKPVQWAWMIATGIYILAALLDVAGVVNLPISVLMVVPFVLLMLGWLVGPSMAELKRMNRRG